MPQSRPTFTLNTGAEMPAIGLGTWLAKPDEVRQAVETALELGYRHIDAARVYGNEHEVGQALASAISRHIVTRDEIWVTSKLWNTDHSSERVAQGLLQSLKDVGVSYLDLYLVHWPLAFKPDPSSPGNNLFPRQSDGKLAIDTEQTVLNTWRSLVDLKRKGMVRAIGLCNVSVECLRHIVEAAQDKDEVPSVVQVEFHPLVAEQQKELKKYCDSQGIIMTAYSPLGNNRIGAPKAIDLPAVAKMASDSGHTEAQLIISWCIGKGVVCIPKSVNASRLASNLAATEIKLTNEQIEALDGLFAQAPQEVGNGRFNIPAKFPAPNGPWPVDFFGHQNEKAVATYKCTADGHVVAI